VGEGFVEPRLDQVVGRLRRFRHLQHGILAVYVLYILVALLGVFVWMLVRPVVLG
jgi:hypothetical protein